MKQTQHKWVKQQLALHGYITRNQCLSNYISRLSAIIQNLESEGYEFKTFRKEGDYVYEVVNAPRKIIRYDLVERNGTPVRIPVWNR